MKLLIWLIYPIAFLAFCVLLAIASFIVYTA